MSVCISILPVRATHEMPHLSHRKGHADVWPRLVENTSLPRLLFSTFCEWLQHWPSGSTPGMKPCLSRLLRNCWVILGAPFKNLYFPGSPRTSPQSLHAAPSLAHLSAGIRYFFGRARPRPDASVLVNAKFSPGYLFSRKLIEGLMGREALDFCASPAHHWSTDIV